MDAEDRRREALRKFMTMAGLKTSPWARKADVPEGALRDYLKGRNRGMNISTYEALANAAGVSVSALIGEPALVERPQNTVTVRGAVQAGSWVESTEWPETEWYDIPMPSDEGRYPRMETFGLEVRGDSMNLLYPEGTVLSCISLILYPLTVRSGQRVIVERENKRGEIESTVKEFVIDEQGRAWLMPRSTNPEFQSPIRADDGVEVRIVALVIRSSRPE